MSLKQCRRQVSWQLYEVFNSKKHKHRRQTPKNNPLTYSPPKTPSYPSSPSPQTNTPIHPPRSLPTQQPSPASLSAGSPSTPPSAPFLRCPTEWAGARVGGSRTRGGKAEARAGGARGCCARACRSPALCYLCCL